MLFLAKSNPYFLPAPIYDPSILNVQKILKFNEAILG